MSLSSADRGAILEVQQRWLDTELHGRGRDLLDLCTDDVVCLPPGERPLRGKAAVAMLWEEQSENISSIHFSEVEIRGDDRIAHKTARFETTIDSVDTGRPHKVCGYHTWILRRTTDSDWKIELFTWSFV